MHSGRVDNRRGRALPSAGCILLERQRRTEEHDHDGDDYGSHGDDRCDVIDYDNVDKNSTEVEYILLTSKKHFKNKELFEPKQ